MSDSENHLAGAPDEPSIFKRKWFLLVMLLLLVMGIGIGVVRYFSSTTPPRVVCYFSVVKFSYEKTRVIIYDIDMNVVLSSAAIPAFFLCSRSDVFVVSKPGGWMSNVNRSRSVPEYPNGVAMGMTMKVDSDIHISRVVFFLSRRRFLAVCKEVLVAESGGALLNGPKPCSSSILSMWK